MSDSEQEKKTQDLVLALNDSRQKEIETIRGRMDDFLRGQLELKHEMEVVANKQDALKERFEEGVSKRLTSLDQKFDKFMMEWGSKQKEDQLRDERIADSKTLAENSIKQSDLANVNAIFYGRAILISVLSGLLLAGLFFVLKTFN